MYGENILNFSTLLVLVNLRLSFFTVYSRFPDGSVHATVPSKDSNPCQQHLNIPKRAHTQKISELEVILLCLSNSRVLNRTFLLPKYFILLLFCCTLAQAYSALKLRNPLHEHWVGLISTVHKLSSREKYGGNLSRAEPGFKLGAAG